MSESRPARGRRRRDEDGPRARRGGRQPARAGTRPAELPALRRSRRVAGRARRPPRPSRRDAGIATDGGPVTELAQLLMAGLDLPSEVDDFHTAVGARGWSAKSIVDNDTFAVLRAGTEQSWGVAVVCGTGINCVGIAPDGRHARFPALGAITGDWGGGYDVGLAASRPPRGAKTGEERRPALEQAVPAYFGLSTPTELAEAIHRGRIPHRRPRRAPAGCLCRGRARRGRLGDRRPARGRGRGAGPRRARATRPHRDPGRGPLGGGLLRGNGTLEAAIEARLRDVGAERSPSHNTAVAPDRRRRPPRPRRARSRPRSPVAGTHRAGRRRGRAGGTRWLTSASSRSRRSTRATRSPPSTRSTSTSPTGS